MSGRSAKLEPACTHKSTSNRTRDRRFRLRNKLMVAADLVGRATAGVQALPQRRAHHSPLTAALRTPPPAAAFVNATTTPTSSSTSSASVAASTTCPRRRNCGCRRHGFCLHCRGLASHHRGFACRLHRFALGAIDGIPLRPYQVRLRLERADSLISFSFLRLER
jgi:hypothetical protein